jgi:hypothetical protein
LARPAGAIVDCLPARLSSEKLTAFVVPVVVAVAVNVPATLFALNSGEVATPAAPVVSAAVAEPPSKLAPAAEAVEPAPPAEPPVPPPEPSAKVTLAPWIGLPLPSRTFTRSGLP